MIALLIITKRTNQYQRHFLQQAPLRATGLVPLPLPLPLHRIIPQDLNQEGPTIVRIVPQDLNQQNPVIVGNQLGPNLI